MASEPDPRRYVELLYPRQDRALAVIASLDTGFYLTGGTAASRGYLGHRFSDDLDLFVNDEPLFALWSDRVVQALAGQEGFAVTVPLKEARYARIVATVDGIDLKIELVNDIPSHVGDVRVHSVLGRLDSPENILANKIAALDDREEPKDLADVWGFCVRMKLPLGRALENAHGKAAGLFPADVARALLRASESDWRLVRWTEAPDPAQYVADLHRLGEELLLIR
jgi:hypothetical protein